MPAKNDFGWAICQAKEGKKIRRSGWNGKNQWVVYMEPMTIPEGLVNERTRKFLPTGPLHVGGYFVIYTESGTWQCGWLASQADMLSDDWEVAEG
jgi:hypothetical protein